jgi:Tfp pilus assembly protein PilO
VKLRQLQRRAQELGPLKDQYQDLKQEVARAEIAPLTEQGLQSFLRELGSRGQAYGVNYISLAPGSTQSGEYYDSIPVVITLQSTYPALGKLLSDLAERQQEIPFTIEEVRIHKIPVDRQLEPGERPDSLEATLTASLYLYKGEQGFTYQSPEEILAEQEQQSEKTRGSARRR